MKLRVRPARRLTGHTEVPGDKSISHRAALLGALAEGVTEVQGYLEAEDCLHTIAGIEALGVEVTRKAYGEYRIAGVGLRGLSEPSDIIDCGNSGTMARLLPGVLAGMPFWTIMTADASMRQRPMGRVAEPLRRMGATVVGRGDGTKLPLAIRGVERLAAIDYTLPVASAQLKSAILLAGLYADGPVTIKEPAASRDHSERMLRRFGVSVESADGTVRVVPSKLAATALRVPGDISSAAFVLAAALVTSDSRVTVNAVGLNPTRTGLLDVLGEMGAKLDVVGRATDDEPIGVITVAASELRGATVGGALIPRLIDEVPALAVVAAVASGRTEIRDAAELRVKESDRIAAIARGLGAMGARVSERPDGIVIEGGTRLRGAHVSSGGDHRLAMALAVAGLVAEGETVVDDTACIETSFPRFAETINALTEEPSLVIEA